MACFRFTIACDSPDCASILVLESPERMHISSFAIVIGARMEAAGWTRDPLGWYPCPDCSPRKRRDGESDQASVLTTDR
jgi:hypothetical protein